MLLNHAAYVAKDVPNFFGHNLRNQSNFLTSTVGSKRQIILPAMRLASRCYFNLNSLIQYGYIIGLAKLYLVSLALSWTRKFLGISRLLGLTGFQFSWNDTGFTGVNFGSSVCNWNHELGPNLDKVGTTIGWIYVGIQKNLHPTPNNVEYLLHPAPEGEISSLRHFYILHS